MQPQRGSEGKNDFLSGSNGFYSLQLHRIASIGNAAMRLWRVHECMHCNRRSHTSYERLLCLKRVYIIFGLCDRSTGLTIDDRVERESVSVFQLFRALWRQFRFSFDSFFAPVELGLRTSTLSIRFDLVFCRRFVRYTFADDVSFPH